MGYVDQAFAKMKSNLEITQTEQDLASARQRAIREHLDKHWDIKYDFLTGSYRRNTKTKYLTDVDIFVVLDADGGQGKYRSQPPGDVLQALAEVLRLKWDNVAVDRMAAVVSWGDDVASFEVVPAFVRRPAGYFIPDTKTEGWIATDPGVHQELTTAKNKECGEKYVPFIKMVKGANRELGDVVSPSFLLEVMALDLVRAPFGRYEDEISWFFATAAEQLDQAWPDPAGLGPDVNCEMTRDELAAGKAALEGAAEVAQRAVWLEDDGQERAAVEQWRSLFGWRMPRP